MKSVTFSMKMYVLLDLSPKLHYQQEFVISGILIRPISDLQLYFCIMDETYAKGINNPKNIVVEKLTNETISNFKKEIENSDVYNKLDKHMGADPKSNFNILSKILNIAKTRHIPKSVKKFNKRKHTKEKWMTNDLLKLVVKKMRDM